MNNPLVDKHATLELEKFGTQGAGEAVVIVNGAQMVGVLITILEWLVALSTLELGNHFAQVALQHSGWLLIRMH